MLSFAFFFLSALEAKAVAPWLIYLGLSAGIPMLLGIIKAAFTVGAFVTIVGGVHYLAGQLITSGINFQSTILDPEKITVIQTIWELLRDFVNIFFILILLVIAFATIFNKPTGYTAKDLLPKLIIAALLINFSLVIATWVIDLLWIPATVFLRPLGPDIGGQIANVLNIQKFFDPGFIAGYFSSGVSEIVEWVFRGVLYVVEAFIFSWIALIIWARIPILIGLMIISPIAWLGLALPAIRKQSWDVWWSKLFCWGSIPIPLFGLIYFVTLFNQRLSAEITQAIPASILDTVLSFIGFNTSQAIVWIITVGLFLGGLMYIKGLSCSMYGWVTAGFGKTWGGVRKGVGATVDFGYAASGYKGAVGQLEKEIPKLGFSGTTQRKARESRREDQLRGLFGLGSTYAAQTNLLSGAEEETKNIDNRFKQARTVDEANQIIAELRTKVESGAKDPETLAAINALAKKGELDVGLFNKAVDNFKDMPLALGKVISEWKEGKFGGITLDEFVEKVRDTEEKLPLDARRTMYSFAASEDGKRVAEKMTYEDFNTGVQVVGRNTKAGRDYFKFWGDSDPTYVAKYRFDNRADPIKSGYSQEDLRGIQSLQDAIREQMKKASVKNIGDYFPKTWDGSEDMDGIKMGERFEGALAAILRDKQNRGTANQFVSELRRKLRREGKDKQLEALNGVMRDIGMRVPDVVYQGEQTESP